MIIRSTMRVIVTEVYKHVAASLFLANDSRSIS